MNMLTSMPSKRPRNVSVLSYRYIIYGDRFDAMLQARPSQISFAAVLILYAASVFMDFLNFFSTFSASASILTLAPRRISSSVIKSAAG